MPQLKLFGPPQSSYVRTARIVCLEKAVPHTLEPIELGSDAHAARHPWKRVPVLEHGDVRLIETSAIARYVDDIGDGPSLVPATPAARGEMEQWISAINCYVYASLVRDYALPHIRGVAPELAAVAAMSRDMARLDAAYANGPHIAGGALSLADLFVAPIVQTVAMFDDGRAALGRSPALARAYEQLAARPSFATVHAGLFGR